MMDAKSIVNQCVKCKSKFTSVDKPLKLLPCLHSMCLDCLYGRVPPVRRASSCVPDSSNKTDVTAGRKEFESDSEANLDSSNNAPSAEVVTETEATKETGNGTNVCCSSTAGSDTAANEEGTADDPSAKRSDSVDHTSNQGDTAKSKSSAEILESSLEAEFSHKDENETSAASVPETDSGVHIEKRETETQDEAIGETPKPVTECPVCRDPIEQPSTTLMDNMFAALDPDQTASPQPDTTHLCTACEENQEAGFYCLQCEEWLCDSCVDAHKRVRVTKDHVISPKNEVKVVINKSPWEQLMMCKQHRQEQLKFFCEKCEMLTCRDCQLMDHKEHKYQFLDHAAEQYKARLKGSLALMGEKRTKLAASRDEIDQKLQNCKEQKDSLQQDILKQADILVKGIRQAVWGVLSNLASFTDAATKRLNKEIDDVSDLIGKFDHCIQFMEDILKEGSSMSLLYSKGNVETKCRKVYHTQVDPQSLKGTLSIAYKHEVNWLLGNLNKIGAIFVNGVRYPPEKNGQGARQSPSCGYQDPRSGGMTATSPHLQHMANQPIPGHRVPSDWTKFIQTVSKPVGQSQVPPNMTMSSLGTTGSLPPQLTLPSNRRTQSGSSMGQPWQGPPGMPGHTFPGHFVAGQLLTPQQQQQQASKPSFTPMRLHHRPATQASFTGQNDHRSQSMRSPPQYRMGGEASGNPRSTHSTPDPARPASAGMYDNNGRPDSGGGSVMVDVKKEKRDHSPDCVIMSSSIKSDRATAYPFPKSETALEMQRNLDEVLRAVPMDLGDNLEQISGSRPRTSVDREHLRSASSDAGLDSLSDIGPHSPSDQELRENWQGGNSMPGFSLSQTDNQGDPNDDYCACCHNGGDVLCCDRCPKVFHLQCHIPELSAVPSGSFVCTMCEGDTPISHEEITASGKRKAPGGLPEHELKVCERILLELFCHPSSVPFQEPVNRMQVPNYYKIITQPKDFTQIRCRLQRSHPHHYQSIKAFLYDLRQVFINCAIYNKTGSEVGKAGKIVRALFESLVELLMPQYLSFVKENPTPCFSALQQQLDPEISNDDGISSGESSPKRQKLDD
ncbi:unnamed protein product [Candidula unifasciata]|uniref:Uncharacterized protein n=1 Tax=Candidula unifasciata TaxID=100452 RepID=A0A8S4A253_9EUPU|nr:unnamed protein product [Candidula unifasciata]